MTTFHESDVARSLDGKFAPRASGETRLDLSMPALRVVDARTGVGSRLWGGEANPHFRSSTSRQVGTQTVVNSRGQYQVAFRTGYFDADNQRHEWTATEFFSPPLDSEDAARSWSDTALSFGRHEYVSFAKTPPPASLPMSSITPCRTCGSFDAPSDDGACTSCGASTSH